jgi:hypothetical protein
MIWQLGACPAIPIIRKSHVVRTFGGRRGFPACRLFDTRLRPATVARYRGECFVLPNQARQFGQRINRAITRQIRRFVAKGQRGSPKAGTTTCSSSSTGCLNITGTSVPDGVIR